MAIMITVRVYTCLLWLVSGALRGVAGRCGALRYKAVPFLTALSTEPRPDLIKSKLHFCIT